MHASDAGDCGSPGVQEGDLVWDADHLSGHKGTKQLVRRSTVVVSRLIFIVTLMLLLVMMMIMEIVISIS